MPPDTTPGKEIYVSVTEGADSIARGGNWRRAYKTLQEAVNKARSGDFIYVAPGEYDEAVTIARAKSNLTIIGVGGRGAVFVAPSTTNATALTIEADDFTMDNVGCDGDGAGHAVVNRGRRTRISRSKIEGGTDGLRLTLGSIAQIDAGTQGKGDDLWFIDCEIASNTNGVNLVSTDYGAVTQIRFRDCTFHDNTKDFFETVGAGGSVGVLFRDLDVEGCKFRRMEDGTEPTFYMDLNGDNANSGVVADCTFPTALAGGKNLVSTALIWTANKHADGISNAQPS